MNFFADMCVCVMLYDLLNLLFFWIWLLGKISFGGNNLHQIRDGIQNPYEDVISVLGRGTKSPFDKDKPVFCFGFGDCRHIFLIFLMLLFCSFLFYLLSSVGSQGDGFLEIYFTAKTRDVSVFSFNPGNKPCLGFDEALSRYRQIVPDLLLAGIFGEFKI